MKTYSLLARKRENLTKGERNALRNKGIVPAVLYDKDYNTPISVFINDLKPVIYTPYTYNISIELEGEVHQSIVHAIQYHPVSDEVIHVDFYKITPDKTIRTRLPVVCFGNPEGVKEGGRFLQKIRKMMVRGKPDDLPEEIRVDVSELQLGDSIKVKDLEEENIEMLNSPENPVCTVSMPRSLKAKGILPEGESAEPEEGEEGEEQEGTEGQESQGKDGDEQGGDEKGGEESKPKE